MVVLIGVNQIYQRIVKVDTEDIQPIKKIKRYEEVIVAIENLIIRKGLKKGDMLPSEKVLSERLDVGSRSIREAYKTLQVRGMVEIKQGKGVFVADNRLERSEERRVGKECRSRWSPYQ